MQVGEPAPRRRGDVVAAYDVACPRLVDVEPVPARVDVHDIVGEDVSHSPAVKLHMRLEAVHRRREAPVPADRVVVALDVDPRVGCLRSIPDPSKVLPRMRPPTVPSFTSTFSAVVREKVLSVIRVWSELSGWPPVYRSQLLCDEPM